MDPSTLLLIVAIVSVAIGYAGGAVVTANRTNKKSSTEDEIVNDEAPASQAEIPAIKVPIAEPPAPPVRESEPVDPNRVDIATLWRELPTGALHADIADRTVKTSKDLNADQRSLLKTLHEDLGNWLGVIPIAAASAPPAAVVPASSMEETRLQSVLAEPIINKTEEAIQPAAEQAPIVPIERKAPQTIVGQIDEILQAQIKGTPLEARGISLVESATHGVTVWIGLKAYQGMDAIPDAEVNTAIRNAVKEWESRK